MLTESELKSAIGNCGRQIEEAMTSNREIDRKMEILDKALAQAQASQSVAKELKSKIRAVDLGDQWIGKHRENVKIHRDDLMSFYAGNLIGDINEMIEEMRRLRMSLALRKNYLIELAGSLASKAERLGNQLQELVSNDSSGKP